MQDKRARASILTNMFHVSALANAAPQSAYSTFEWEKDCKVLDATRRFRSLADSNPSISHSRP